MFLVKNIENHMVFIGFRWWRRADSKPFEKPLVFICFWSKTQKTRSLFSNLRQTLMSNFVAVIKILKNKSLFKLLLRNQFCQIRILLAFMQFRKNCQKFCLASNHLVLNVADKGQRNASFNPNEILVHQTWFFSYSQSISLIFLN